MQLVPEFGVVVSRPVHDVGPSWAGEEDGMFSQYSYSHAPPSQTQTYHTRPFEAEYADVGIDVDLDDRPEQLSTTTKEVQHSILAEAITSPAPFQPICSSPTAQQQVEPVVEEEKKESEAEESATATATTTQSDFTCPYPHEPIGAQTLQLPVNLDKWLLDDCITLGQSDRKYILVMSGEQLLAIDQHAADERLRLERFEARLDVSKGAGSVMKSIELHPPHVMQVAETTVDLLEHAAETFFHWNFKYELDRDACTVSLLEVPVVTGEVLTANDFLEYVDYVSTRTSFPVSMLRPPAVTRILASRACRGAIMFGETLELDRCSKIIDGLRSCNFPFQCAHGRPSIVPLFDIASAHRAKSSRKRKADLPSRFRRRHPF
jgi:DNA mismatch repair protein MLH3